MQNASVMKHRLHVYRLPLCLSLAILVTSVGQAQMTIDVAKITCSQLTLLKVDPDYIALWLSGYYNGKRNNTIVDVEQFKELATKVKRDCLYNNQGTVMETVERLTGPQK
ncbi:MAG TPA: HdeA/HdeB family chaperone [Xanthobacteraceae bacterium]|nr:HdeA/HdeB family chaperone [Xanthobacteraceae bacterium]